MEEIAKVLSNYGFPIAITVFLLVRMERTITDMKAAFDRTITKIEELINIVRELVTIARELVERRKR